MKKLHEKDSNKSTEFLLENCELIVAGKNLLDGAKIQLNHGHKYGLIGRNGVGKVLMHLIIKLFKYFLLKKIIREFFIFIIVKYKLFFLLKT